MGSKKVEIISVPSPRCGADQLVIQTAVSLISAGTERASRQFAESSLIEKARSRPDLAVQIVKRAINEGIGGTAKAVRTRLSQPEGLGYSLSGTVVEVPPKHRSDFAPGDLVACAGAGHAVHAEVVAVPRNLIVKIPPGVDLESAAFAAIGAIALQGLRQADIQLGEFVAVIGLGLVGQLAASLANTAGCKVIGIDLSPERVAVAQEMGANLAVLRDSATGAIQSMTDGRGVDAVLICADTTTNDPLQLAGLVARSRGKVVVVGSVDMTVPRDVYYRKELDLRLSRSLGPGRYDDLYEERGVDYPYEYVRWTENRNMQAFIALLSSRRIDVKPLITHRFSLEDAVAAYELITGKQKESCLGVLLTYQDADSSASFQGQPTCRQALECKAEIAPRTKPLPKHSKTPRIRIGLLGAGSFARSTLLPALQKNNQVELITVVSATGLSARQVADRFGFRYAATQEEEIWTDPEIDAVIIATRHHLHARQVIAALSAHKHVFVEKPLCLTLKELDAIQAAYQAAQKEAELGQHDTNPPILMVGYNRRFAPLTERLKIFFAATSEPKYVLYRVNAGYIPQTHWVQDLAQGGGRIIGEVCHFADMVYYLVGSVRPVSIYTVGLPNFGRYVDDNVTTAITFADGSIGTVSYLANGSTAIGKERIEVYSQGRTAILDDFRSLKLAHDDHSEDIRQKGRHTKGHVGELDAFFGTLRRAESPPMSFDEILVSTRLTFAIIESLRRGEPVKWGV